MPDYDDMNDRANVYDNNPGLAEAMAEGDLWPKDAYIVNDIIAGLTDPASGHMPGYIDTFTNDAGNVVPVIDTIDRTYSGPYEPGHIYNVACQSNQILQLPTGVVISEVVIVADCKIKASAGVMLEDVVLASKSTGNGQNPYAQNSIDLAAAAQLGASDFCDTGSGGVEIYSAASAHIAASLDVNGLRAVVAGDFQLAAGGDIYGVAVQAGNNVSATANGEFGLCPDGTPPPGQFTWHYRLVL